MVVGGIPAGSTSLGRVVQGELVDPTDRESVSLGGASPLSPTILPGAEATADRHRTFNPVW